MRWNRMRLLCFLTWASLWAGTQGLSQDAVWTERRPFYTRLRLDRRPTSTPGPTSSSTGPADLPLGYIILSMKEEGEESRDWGDERRQADEDYVSSTARIQELIPVPVPPDSGPDLERVEPERGLLGGFLRREIWTIPLLSLSGLNLFLISVFEVYVLVKGKGRGPLFLGQVLLFGLFAASALPLLFVLEVGQVGCWVGRVGISLLHALLLDVLIVKSIFLLSLEAGRSLSWLYQATLLLFIALVQLAINLQWTLNSPPTTAVGRSIEAGLLEDCGSSYRDFLLTGLPYNGFLVLFLGGLSLKTRHIRDNYRESTYIAFSLILSVPIWMCWTVAGWILNGKHEDACLGFGLLAQSLATFLIMFMPKGRQLAAMGKEGLFVEDSDEVCSGYSPSFFHFKPLKAYKATLVGDPNVYTSLEPTISTLNPNVFFHRSDFHPGMIY